MPPGLISTPDRSRRLLTARSFTASPAWTDLSLDVVHYGPDIPTEADLRLLGPLEGKRVLELGCGGGPMTVAMAKQGARVIAVDESARAGQRTPAGSPSARRSRSSCIRAISPTSRSCGPTPSTSPSASTRSAPSPTSTVCSGRCTVCCDRRHRSCLVAPPGLPGDRTAPATRRRCTARTSTARRVPWSIGDDTGQRLPAHDQRSVHEPDPGQLPRRRRPRARAGEGRPPQPRTGPRSMRWVPATLIVRARKQGI